MADLGGVRSRTSSSSMMARLADISHALRPRWPRSSGSTRGCWRSDDLLKGSTRRSPHVCGTHRTAAVSSGGVLGLRHGCLNELLGISSVSRVASSAMKFAGWIVEHGKIPLFRVPRVSLDVPLQRVAAETAGDGKRPLTCTDETHRDAVEREPLALHTSGRRFEPFRAHGYNRCSEPYLGLLGARYLCPVSPECPPTCRYEGVG